MNDLLLIRKSSSYPIPGKFAVFKAKIVGTPTPIVTWSRANGEIHFHPDVCEQKYDEVSEEYTIEVSYTCSHRGINDDNLQETLKARSHYVSNQRVVPALGPEK